MLAPDVKRPTRRQILGWGAGLGLGALGLDAFAYEPQALGLKTLEVPISGLGRAFDGYRVAFVTDIHYPRHIGGDLIRESVELAKSFRPDLLLFGGDYVDGKAGSAVPSLAGLFDGASAPDGVYGVLGNHDWWLDGEGTRRELERTSPIRLIDNANTVLTRGDDRLALAGLEDLWCRVPDLDVALRGVPEDVPRLLLSHNPDTAESVRGELKASSRVDLQLSGHTHGGEVRLPLYGPPYIPSRYGRKFERGLVRGRLHPVYVSVGIASPRGVRFRCHPEVTGIVLRAA